MTAAVETLERPRPTGSRGLRLTRIAAVAVVLTVLALMPTLQSVLGFGTYNLVYLYFVFFWVTQATSWNMFSGYSGYFSFGQSAFYGAGVYTTAILVTRFGSDLLPALPLGGLVAAVIGLLAGLVVFRLRTLRGEIFALFTLSLALGLGQVANNFDFIDGGQGIVLGAIRYPAWLGSTTDLLYYLGLALAVVAVVIAYLIQHSRFGFGLFAIRDDEHVGETLGVPVFRYKLAVFTISCAIAGMSGALHAVLQSFVTAGGTFELEVPLFVILMSVVGGRRHWAGPIIGAVLIYTITDRLTSAQLVEVNRILIGLILIVVVVRLRGGIFDQLQRRPVVAPVVGGVVLAVLAITRTGGPMIAQLLFAMIAAVLVLFLPDGLYARLAALGRGRRDRDGDGRDDDAPPGSARAPASGPGHGKEVAPDEHISAH